MNETLKQFVAYLQAQDRSPHTVAAYRRDVAAFFAWLSGQVGKETPPVEVTAFDVQKYRDYLVNEGRKPAGVNRRLAALRVFFDWTVTESLAASNPAAGVQSIRQERRKPKALTAQEVYRLQRTAAAQRQLAEAQANPGSTETPVEEGAGQSQPSSTPKVLAVRCDEAILALLLYSGIRVSEAADLLMDDVVLNERSGKVIVRSGKGRKYREVPLHKEARKALKAYLEVRPATGGDKALFVGQRGALGTRSIQLRLAALGEAAKVKITPHVLRHTFGTRLLREAKVDLVTVSELMGHSSVATTAIYTQPSEADLVNAVESLA